MWQRSFISLSNITEDACFGTVQYHGWVKLWIILFWYTGHGPEYVIGRVTRSVRDYPIQSFTGISESLDNDLCLIWEPDGVAVTLLEWDAKWRTYWLQIPIIKLKAYERAVSINKTIPRFSDYRPLIRHRNAKSVNVPFTDTIWANREPYIAQPRRQPIGVKRLTVWWGVSSNISIEPLLFCCPCCLNGFIVVMIADVDIFIYTQKCCSALL